MASCAPAAGGTRRWVAGRGRRVVTGPGSGFPEEPAPGVRAGRAGDRAVPRLPSRARGAGGGLPGIGLKAGEHGIADLPFQRTQGLFRGLALGQFLVVVSAALAVPVTDLGDRSHVNGVVEPAVPAPRQPAGLPAAGGHLDRRGPVVSSEVVPAREPGHLAGIADDGGGDDGADPEQAGQAGPGRGDGDREQGGRRFEGQANRDLSTLRPRLTAIPARTRTVYPKSQLGGYVRGSPCRLDHAL
jgi:hypothetical protein